LGERAVEASLASRDRVRGTIDNIASAFKALIQIDENTFIIFEYLDIAILDYKITFSRQPPIALRRSACGANK
jgi:hypothetical protein